jgi:hypothetical protein
MSDKASVTGNDDLYALLITIKPRRLQYAPPFASCATNGARMCKTTLSRSEVKVVGKDALTMGGTQPFEVTIL